MALNYKNIFKSNKTKLKSLWGFLNDDKALFSEFGTDIYMSDFVNNAIDRIATEVSKIEVVSIVERNSIVKRQNDDISRLFKFQPNPLQTTKDFLSCCEWLRRKNNNCFIYPQYIKVKGADGIEYKKYIALYPLNPTKVEFGIDDLGAIWEVKLSFKNGEEYVLPYNEIIHLRWRRGKNNIIGGGDDNAQIDNRDTLKSLNVLHQIMEGIPKSIEASLKIKGLYKAKSLIGTAKLKQEREDFEEHIKVSSSGIVATDLTGDFIPININPTKIDPEVFKFLKSIIREKYGISDAILDGDYNGEQHSAFYQSCIEDFIIEFEQAASAVLFSQREQDVGHRVKAYYSRIAYMNNSDKIQLATISTNTALMSKDELREMFGLVPVGGKEGSKFIQSLNFVEEGIAAQYQLKKEKGGNLKDET